MIDARRWILVETWLSLGLRIEWCPSWERDAIAAGDWLDDDDDREARPRPRFIYAGQGTWWVDPGDRYRYGTPPNAAPQLSAAVLGHELAHYLSATDEERGLRNFGASPTITSGISGDPANTEDRAVAAEKVIDAILAASARIANMALGGRA